MSAVMLRKGFVCLAVACVGVVGAAACGGGYDQHVWRSRNPDRYLRDLEELVVTDLGKQSASCERVRRLLSVCTLQGAHKPDRFQVCVTRRLWLQYSPVRRCGVDAPGLTKVL
jgi:hypothetical protein